MSSTFQLDESDILFTLFEHLPSNGDVRMLELRSHNPHSSQNARFGCFSLTSDPPLHVISTLSTPTNHVFLVITRGTINDYLPVLTTIKKIDAQSPLSYGEHVHIEDERLVQAGRVGAVFLDPSFSPALLGFPKDTSIDGHMVQFFLTIFLDATDYEHLQKTDLTLFVRDVLKKRTALAEPELPPIEHIDTQKTS